MKKLFKFFACFMLVILFILLGTFVLLFQSQPKTEQQLQISPQAAEESKALAKRLVNVVKQTGEQYISVNQGEVNGLLALLHRAQPGISADVNLEKGRGMLEASIETPVVPLLRFLNVKAIVLSSKNGLLIEQVSLGHLTFSGETFLNFIALITDNVLKENMLSDVLHLIKRVDITPKNLAMIVELDSTLSSDNKSMLVALRDELALFGDVSLVTSYYQHLEKVAARQSRGISVARLLNQLFTRVIEETTINDNKTAIEQNQAALLALSVYLGSDRFELFIGEVINKDANSLAIRRKMKKYTTLQGRNDLQKHFVYSIALQVFSSVGASDAIGEYKEFLDANQGGSGFSFADLQADRAGTRLAMIATSNEYRAIRAQQILSQVTDQELLPSIDQLEEGLSAEAFKLSYRDVSSKTYQQKLNRIDDNLKTLPIYQLGWQ